MNQSSLKVDKRDNVPLAGHWDGILMSRDIRVTYPYRGMSPPGRPASMAYVPPDESVPFWPGRYWCEVGVDMPTEMCFTILNEA